MPLKTCTQCIELVLNKMWSAKSSKTRKDVLYFSVQSVSVLQLQLAVAVFVLILTAGNFKCFFFLQNPVEKVSLILSQPLLIYMYVHCPFTLTLTDKP